MLGLAMDIPYFLYLGQINVGFSMLSVVFNVMPQINMIPPPSHFKLTMGEPALL